MLMDTLTKEYFDEHMDRIDTRFDAVEKKIEDEVQGLATIVANGFAELEKRLDVQERVEKLEKKMTKVETALNVHL